MSEQIQKAFDEWILKEEYTAEELAFRGINFGYATKSTAFHGGYTACQARIREMMAELQKEIDDIENALSLGTYRYKKSSQIVILREVLGEI
jgi:thermostable 8-oxoguanine DNA glycosylase